MNAGAAEFFELGLDLTKAGGAMTRPMQRVFAQAGEAAARQWAANARQTSGKHGRWYPSSIDSEARFTFGGNIEVEVGPNAAKKQGRMGRGFEFGSKNQHPHLDGVKAFDGIEPALEQRAADLIAGIIKVGSGTSSPLREYTTRSGTTRLASEAQIANWTRGR